MIEKNLLCLTLFLSLSSGSSLCIYQRSRYLRQAADAGEFGTGEPIMGCDLFPPRTCPPLPRSASHDQLARPRRNSRSWKRRVRLAGMHDPVVSTQSSSAAISKVQMDFFAKTPREHVLGTQY